MGTTLLPKTTSKSPDFFIQTSVILACRGKALARPPKGNIRNLPAICLRLLNYSWPFPSLLHWWLLWLHVIVTTMLVVAQSAEQQDKGSNVDVSTKGHGLAVDGQLAAVMMKIALEVTPAEKLAS